MITNKTKIQKFLAAVILVSATVGATAFVSIKAISAEIPAEYRYKNQYVTLPPEIAAFLNAKEQQAEALAQKQKFTLDRIVKSYFDEAKAGHVGVAQILFQDISERAHDTNVTGQLKSPIWGVIIDAALTVDAVGENDPNFVLATAREMTNSLVPGLHLFWRLGCRAWLADDALLRAGRTVFRDQPESALQWQLCGTFASRNMVHAFSFRQPTKFRSALMITLLMCRLRAAKGQLKPGENFRMEDGKPKIEGQVAYMEINALIAKSIFDKNPDRDFYYEESFPLDWMYPYLSPHGLLMKLNRQPLNEMPADEIHKDEDFWSKELAGKIGDWLANDTPVSNVCAYAEKVFASQDLSDFKGDPKFIANEYITAYSHWRSSIAGIYAWRLSQQCPPEYRPKNDAQRKRLTDAADFAFRQTFALCPYSPEAVFRNVKYLMNSTGVTIYIIAKTSEESHQKRAVCTQWESGDRKNTARLWSKAGFAKH